MRIALYIEKDYTTAEDAAIDGGLYINPADWEESYPAERDLKEIVATASRCLGRVDDTVSIAVETPLGWTDL